jgi:hypothetical protein
MRATARGFNAASNTRVGNNVMALTRRPDVDRVQSPLACPRRRHNRRAHRHDHQDELHGETDADQGDWLR